MFRTKLILFVFFSFFGLIARAQQNLNISFGPEFGLPSGNFTNLSAIGVGASLKAEFPIAANVAISVNGGLINFFGKRNQLINVQDLTYLPVKSGLKYYLGEGFYAEGQLGAAFPLNDGQKRLFVWSPGLGNQFKLPGKNKLDLGIRYEGWTGAQDNAVILSNNSNTKGFVGIRFAYVFCL